MPSILIAGGCLSWFFFARQVTHTIQWSECSVRHPFHYNIDTIQWSECSVRHPYLFVWLVFVGEWMVKVRQRQGCWCMDMCTKPVRSSVGALVTPRFMCCRLKLVSVAVRHILPRYVAVEHWHTPWVHHFDWANTSRFVVQLRIMVSLVVLTRCMGSPWALAGRHCRTHSRASGCSGSLSMKSKAIKGNLFARGCKVSSLYRCEAACGTAKPPLYMFHNTCCLTLECMHSQGN